MNFLQGLNEIIHSSVAKTGGYHTQHLPFHSLLSTPMFWRIDNMPN